MVRLFGTLKRPKPRPHSTIEMTSARGRECSGHIAADPRPAARRTPPTRHNKVAGTRVASLPASGPALATVEGATESYTYRPAAPSGRLRAADRRVARPVPRSARRNIGQRQQPKREMTAGREDRAVQAASAYRFLFSPAPTQMRPKRRSGDPRRSDAIAQPRPLQLAAPIGKFTANNQGHGVRERMVAPSEHCPGTYTDGCLTSNSSQALHHFREEPG